MVSDEDEAYLVDGLTRDVSSTLGGDHRELIRAEARDRRQFDDDCAGYFYMVVQNVQQHFHDCRVDITWPACPRHPNHPMWFENGMWCADGKPVAKLGELGDWLRDSRI
jgi:hypothetical protein